MALNDVQQLSTNTLIEDLGRFRRHAVATRGNSHTQFTEKVTQLEAELRRRGKDPEDLGLPVVTPPTPCRLIPLGDHLVVRPDDVESVTEGGIIIPDTAKEKPLQGTVLAVGPGRIEPGVGTVVPAVRVDDVVLFGRYSGVEVVLDDVRVLVLREEDVLGTLAPKAA